MEWWLAYLAIGLAVGFFAGLLGIGGGAVMVPMLVLVFNAQGMPADHIMHVALGTAMATIMFTSVSSMRAHHAHAAHRTSVAGARRRATPPELPQRNATSEMRNEWHSTS